ncbi:MAG: ROK family protein [Anaerolineaceae bacterium]|nr:ROK family protein [Anaerolineaceae bacterium]
MGHFIGIDLGGTKIAAIAYEADAQRVIYKHTVPTDRQQGSDAVVAQMIELSQAIADGAGWPRDQISGVGVGVPATVDYDIGTTIMLPNIPGDWVDKPVAPTMQAVLGCPVALINDARAFTLAEATLGAGRDYPVVAGVTLGTGIGGGIAIDGKLFLGMEGSAGEFGHMSIDYGDLPDGSGTPGGLERYSSGPAIAAAAIKYVVQGADTSIGALVDYDLNKITPHVVAQAADDGDEVAQDILYQAGIRLGAGLSVVLGVLNPHAMVIGGGMANLGERILGPMREGLKIYNRTTSVDKLAIVPAELDDAGSIGAALWAKQHVERLGRS